MIATNKNLKMNLEIKFVTKILYRNINYTIKSTNKIINK